MHLKHRLPQDMKLYMEEFLDKDFQTGELKIDREVWRRKETPNDLKQSTSTVEHRGVCMYGCQ